jgi:hypothetical protein
MQTTYDLETPIGVEGQKIEDVESEITTGISEAGIIQVGKLVILDTTTGRANKSVRAPTATGDVTGPAVAGLSMWDPTYPEPPYAQYKTFPVMRKGRMLVVSETLLGKGIYPFVRFAAGAGGTVLGSIRADADTASAVACPYITVITPALTVGGLCIVEINI